MAATTKFDKKKQLTASEIYQLARSAGLGQEEGIIATAVAFGESGGNAKSIPPPNTDGSTDAGLWQINSVHKIPHSILLIPSKNADAMARISKNGKDWSPWVAYTNGSYKQHMKKAIDGSARTDVKDTSIGDDVANKVFGLDSLKALFDVIFGILTAFTDRGFWVRAGKILLGFIILIMGLSKLGRAIGTGRVAKDVRSATRGTKGAVGTAAKVAKKVPNPATKAVGTAADTVT